MTLAHSDLCSGSETQWQWLEWTENERLEVATSTRCSCRRNSFSLLCSQKSRTAAPSPGPRSPVPLPARHWLNPTPGPCPWPLRTCRARLWRPVYIFFLGSLLAITVVSYSVPPQAPAPHMQGSASSSSPCRGADLAAAWDADQLQLKRQRCQVRRPLAEFAVFFSYLFLCASVSVVPLRRLCHTPEIGLRDRWARSLGGVWRGEFCEGSVLLVAKVRAWWEFAWLIYHGRVVVVQFTMAAGFWVLGLWGRFCFQIGGFVIIVWEGNCTFLGNRIGCSTFDWTLFGVYSPIDSYNHFGIHSLCIYKFCSFLSATFDWFDPCSPNYLRCIVMSF
jgi:hypothetical protein